jgi:hypothetical protein
MKIFIEHTLDLTEFAERLVRRLKVIKGVDIKTYSDYVRINPEITDEELIKDFDNYDVLIPIVEEGYSLNEVINDKLEEISDLDNKAIFPIIYHESQWSSINWIVKSKVFPETGSPYVGLDENSKANTLNKLVKTIESMISQINVPISDPIEDNDNIIFISHAHDDADFAELLKFQLEKNGISAWIDGEKLKIGQDWRQEIDDGINKSIAMIVIMTPQAKMSEYVTYEWAYGWGKDIPIFPLMLKQTPLHPRLESLQYLDFTNRLTRPWQKLIESIKTLQK